MHRHREVYVYYQEVVWGGARVMRDNFTEIENSPASEWDGKCPDWDVALESQLRW